MPETAPVPTPDRKPAWRAAAITYRDQRRAGASHYPASRAEVEALQAAWPLPIEEARRGATHAIAYASTHHTKWFWEGVSG